MSAEQTTRGDGIGVVQRLARSLAYRTNRMLTSARDKATLARQRRMIRTNEEEFGRVYQEIEKRQFNTMAARRANLPKDQASAVADELDRTGLACWRGLFADEGFLASAREFTRTVGDLADQAFARDTSGAADIMDEARHLRYARADNISAFGGRTYGRSRAYWTASYGPDPSGILSRVAGDETIAAVLESYLGTRPVQVAVLAERLVPSVEGDDWHIDCYDDQVKAMILLDDVGMEQGPMRYKLGSHRCTTPAKRELLFELFRKGDDWAYPSPRVVTAMPGEIAYCTGKAGDCYFFDTLGIHSGTRCLSGERLALVVYPVVWTMRAQALSVLTSPHSSN